MADLTYPMLNTIDQKLINRLKNICPDGIKQNISLKNLSRWKIGGDADCLVFPQTEAQLLDIVRLCNETNNAYVVLGGTTNLLFSDRGLKVLGIVLTNLYGNINIKNDCVNVQAGRWVPSLARTVGNNGLSGLEHIIGIPGTVGGLVCMNGGSLRNSIGDNIDSVRFIDDNANIKILKQDACGFKYRDSIFQNSRWIITEVSLKFFKKDKPESIRATMLKILRQRRSKFPLKLPNCGSVFVSDPAMYEEFGPPGMVIEKCGLKGWQEGGVKISDQHANFIVNVNHGTAQNVIKLIEYIRDQAYAKLGANLRCEVRFVDEFGRITPIHEIIH